MEIVARGHISEKYSRKMEIKGVVSLIFLTCYAVVVRAVDEGEYLTL